MKEIVNKPLKKGAQLDQKEEKVSLRCQKKRLRFIDIKFKFYIYKKIFEKQKIPKFEMISK